MFKWLFRRRQHKAKLAKRAAGLDYMLRYCDPTERAKVLGEICENDRELYDAWVVLPYRKED
ncbi:MAG: hypothetical protein CL484_03140 [Acidobacteria bacterium]|nr:hypothetical protein [Acidobacteriota bacterium]|tara:strand:- start:996 stop:1181 length:186 start_codon:yes stop_codon:yes gene_type:complete